MKYWLFLFLVISLMSFAVAQSSEIQTLGNFAKGSSVNLRQICSNCTFSNITAVLYPNSSISISNVQMTKIGTNYNYTLAPTFTQTLGRYIVEGVSDLNGQATVWSYDFFITPTGKSASDGESRILIFLIISVFAISIVLFIYSRFIEIESVRMFMILLALIFFIGAIMLTTTLAQNYVEDNELLGLAYERILQLVFYLGFAAAMMLLVIVVIKVINGLRRTARFSD